MSWREDQWYEADEFNLADLIGIATLLAVEDLTLKIQQMEERIMATLDDVSAALDAQKASLDNLTTLEAAEAAGGLQPGQVAVEQATIDAVSQKVADNQAEIDALIAQDQTAQPAPPADGGTPPAQPADQPQP